MNIRAINKALEVMGAALRFTKTASNYDNVLEQIDDAYIKIAESNNTKKSNYKVANLMSDVIKYLGLQNKVDVYDFITKTATAEKIYEKLANSNDIVERDLSALAKYHINAMFNKIAQIAVDSLYQEEIDPYYIQHLINSERDRANKFKNIAMYGIPTALGIGMTLPWLVDRIRNKKSRAL